MRRDDDEERTRDLADTEETSVEELLEEAKATDFSDPDAESQFQKRHHIRLTKKTSRAGDFDVLNTIASYKSLSGYKQFARWAIRKHANLLLCKSDGGHTPLHLAIRQNNYEFVGLVLLCAKNLHEVLCQTSNDSLTCLHFALHARSWFTEKIIDMVLELAAKNAGRSGSGGPSSSQLRGIFSVQRIDLSKHREYDKMTPLHVAVVTDEKSKADEKDPRQAAGSTSTIKRQAVSSKAKPVNASAGASAGAGAGAGAHASGDGSNNKPVDAAGGDVAAADSFVMINRRPRRTPTMMDTPPSQELDLFQGIRRFNVLNIVKKLVAASPDVLVLKDNDDNTPFQALLEFLRYVENKKHPPPPNMTEAEHEARRRKQIEGNRILTFLREYIIDHFDRRGAMKALYKVGDERVLEFDLSGLPYSTINSEFLSGLGKVLRFEGLLKYVALPRLTVLDDDPELDGEPEGSDAAEVPPSKPGDAGAGLQYMCIIFRWLRKNHVKKVLKVSVVDDGEVSHSDDAIERCLKGMEVRIWNWFKADLCIDVIAEAAPQARDVTLYSSGNNAVLVGWASPDGLKKLKEMKQVHVYVQLGLEAKSRIERYMKQFTETLQRNAPDIVCTWEFFKQDSSYNSVFVPRDGEKITESKWMRAVLDFAEFLRMAKPDQPVRPVRIAIIDDGIDTRLDDFAGKIQNGDSFFRLGEMFGRRGTYYVPTGRHGTLMAQTICKVCPVVKLYIAQLEDLPGQNGKRAFTAESATEALSWAIDQGVDIVSMSWSISGSNDLKDLAAQLSRAEKAGILLFCASIDEGPTAEDRTYPGRTDKCIKIGASTAYGAKLSWVSESKSQFLLPGEAPVTTKAVAPGTADGPAQQHHPPYMGSYGSSVATAFAAGIAGVLLFCDRLLKGAELEAAGSRTDKDGSKGEGGGEGEGEGEGEYLRNREKMLWAFQQLCSGVEKSTFVNMAEKLPRNPQSLVWNSKVDPDGTAATRTKLEGFMKGLKY